MTCLNPLILLKFNLIILKKDKVDEKYSKIKVHSNKED